MCHKCHFLAKKLTVSMLDHESSYQRGGEDSWEDLCTLVLTLFHDFHIHIRSRRLCHSSVSIRKRFMLARYDFRKGN